MDPASAVRGKLRLLILHVLREGPLSGYEVRKRLGSMLGRPPSPGTVYPLLRGLVRDGLVEARIRGQGGRVAKTYVLTEAGARLLEESRGELEEVLSLVEALRLAGETGLRDLLYSFWRLIELLPRLRGEELERVAEFAARVRGELERLVEELGGGSG